MPDGVEDVPAVPPDLALKLHEGRDAAALRPGDPAVQARRRLVGVGNFEDEPELFLHGVGAGQGAVLGLDGGQRVELALREVLRRLPEGVFGVLDRVRGPARVPDRRLRREGYYVGLGLVESACKMLVAARCKLAGMHWRHQNAAAVALLRAALRANFLIAA